MKVVRTIQLPLLSAWQRPLLICSFIRNTGEFGSLLSDHPVANREAKVRKQEKPFKVLGRCEHCDSLLPESGRHGVLRRPHNRSRFSPGHESTDPLPRHVMLLTNV